jgi:hypothetical protein
MASMIAFGVYDVVLGSRILGGGARKGGMPFYKYVANRCRFGRREHVGKPQAWARQVSVRTKHDAGTEIAAFGGIAQSITTPATPIGTPDSV